MVTLEEYEAGSKALRKKHKLRSKRLKRHHKSEMETFYLVVGMCAIVLISTLASLLMEQEHVCAELEQYHRDVYVEVCHE